MMQEIENEAQGASSSIPVGGGGQVAGGARMTFAEKVTTSILSGAGTVFLVLLGIALRRKRHAAGVEDAAWGISSATIERQAQQIATLQKELDEVRKQRNEFEAASIRAEANSKTAAEMAARAAEMAQRNEAELVDRQRDWERAQRYIRLLRSTLATHGIQIPEEPDL